MKKVNLNDETLIKMLKVFYKFKDLFYFIFTFNLTLLCIESKNKLNEKIERNKELISIVFKY
jgi:hypothetical protein